MNGPGDSAPHVEHTHLLVPPPYSVLSLGDIVKQHSSGAAATDDAAARTNLSPALPCCTYLMGKEDPCAYGG